jgi:hypothetical protein
VLHATLGRYRVELLIDCGVTCSRELALAMPPDLANIPKWRRCLELIVAMSLK